MIITSRRRLAGLAGSVHVETQVFDAGTAVDLLARIAGPDRVRARPEAAAVAGQCGQLPLALRIAGARLAARPHWDLRQLAERLADETRRLDELSHGDMHVRASFSLTYENTSAAARRLFRRLALLEAPAFSGWLGAALLEAPLTQAEDLFDELVSVHLVEATGEPSQYRCHDLRPGRRTARSSSPGTPGWTTATPGRCPPRPRNGWPRTPRPGSSGSGPRWSPGSGRRPGPGCPGCARG